jgi:4-amino-4-deoxy-L-arabinose transferase-like glycosyltransferase
MAHEALRREEYSHLSALLLLLISALVVRIWFLFQPIRYDEAFTFLQFASKPLYRGLSDYSYPNNHPLHTFLVHIAHRIFGSQPWVIRLPACCAGLLTVAASYVTSRIVFDKRCALLTAAFVASSPMLILYSTNARGYMMICLVFLSLYVLGIALLRKNTPGRWLLFTILSAAGWYTIPVMLYPFGTIVIWLCLSVVAAGNRIDRRSFLQHLLISLVAVAALTGIAYLPIIAVSGIESLVGHRFIHPLPWSDCGMRIPSYIHSLWLYWNTAVPAWITVLCAVGCVASFILYRRLSNVPVPIVAAVPIWFVALILVLRVMPHGRVWLYLMPVYFMYSASGISYFAKRLAAPLARYAHAGTLLSAAAPVALACWLSCTAIQTKSIIHLPETGTLPDAQPIALYMKGYLKPGDAVYAPCPSDAPLRYYFMLHNIPLAHLSFEAPGHYKRIVVIVNHDADQTLEGLLVKAHLERAPFSAPKTIKEYDSATLYELERAEGYVN